MARPSSTSSSSSSSSSSGFITAAQKPTTKRPSNFKPAAPETTRKNEANCRKIEHSSRVNLLQQFLGKLTWLIHVCLTIMTVARTNILFAPSHTFCFDLPAARYVSFSRLHWTDLRIPLVYLRRPRTRRQKCRETSKPQQHRAGRRGKNW